MKAKSLLRTSLWVSFVLFFQLAHGQYFNVFPPVNAQTSCALLNTGLSHSETAVDILGIDCATYKAVVSNTHLNIEYYDCSSPDFPTAFPLSFEITNPDVSLMIDQSVHIGNVYAIVVGYDVNNTRYIAEGFDVTDINNIFQVFFEELLVLNSNFPNPNDNAIRIDANEVGDFVIVWDDLDRNKISLIVGYAYNQFAFPGLSAYTDASGNIILTMKVDLPHDNVGKPDVSIASHVTAKIENIFITYLDLANVEVFVDQYNYADFWYTGPLFPSGAISINPPTSNVIYNTSYSGNIIGRPRIAVPGSDGGMYFLKDAWTIVYSVNDGTYSHIHGNSRLDMVDKPHVYTDNSEPIFMINGGTVSFNDWLGTL